MEAEVSGIVLVAACASATALCGLLAVRLYQVAAAAKPPPGREPPAADRAPGQAHGG